MANVVITPLGNTAFNSSFVRSLNNNLSKLAEAVNNDLLWRGVGPAGGQSMRQHLDMNGCYIFNAVVDGMPLTDVKRKAVASAEWATASEQYASDAGEQAEEAFKQATIAAFKAGVASSKANELSQAVSDVFANKTDISALAAAVTANKVSADSTASSLSTLSSTVASNKTAANATASSLTTLSSTVTTNKTAADATAASLSTLNTTVSGHTSSISALTTTANSALPKAGGTMTGALTMGANVINLGSDVLSSNQSCTYSTAPFWSASGYRCQQGKSGYAGSNNFYNFYWNSSSEVEVWIDTSRVGKITLAAVSDKQLKEDISYVEEDALSQVEQWKPAMFSYKARGILPKSALQMGFIANDLVAVSPECVTGKGLGEVWDENAPEGAYELVPVAIMAKMSRAIQQLSERVKQLEK